MVDGSLAFHLCSGQEDGEKQSARATAAVSTPPLLGSFLGSLTLELSLTYH